MISHELNDIVWKLKRKGKMYFLNASEERQILNFENSNAFKLPQKFKEWLIFSDGGELFLPAGVQLYGVAHKPLIDADCDDRPDKNYLIIGSLANGDPILCEKDSEKISIYNQEAGKIETDEIYDDFFSFLNDLPDLLGIQG